MDPETTPTVEPENESILSPVGYHFRFTFSNQSTDLRELEDKNFTHQTKLLHKALISKLSDLGYFYLGQCTSGYEFQNKRHEHCKAHLHISFMSTKIKKNMNKTIKRFMEENDQDYLGNSCYSFKEQPQIRDMDRFWRYPLKQRLAYSVCRGFTDQRLLDWHNIATGLWNDGCQYWQEKDDKRDKDDTLYLKVLSLLKRTNDNSKRAIAKTFYEYYHKEHKPINRTTIAGYVCTAQLDTGSMTIDEMLDEHGY